MCITNLLTLLCSSLLLSLGLLIHLSQGLRAENKVHVQFFPPGPQSQEDWESKWISVRDISGWKKYDPRDILAGKAMVKGALAGGGR